MPTFASAAHHLAHLGVLECVHLKGSRTPYFSRNFKNILSEINDPKAFPAPSSMLGVLECVHLKESRTPYFSINFKNMLSEINDPKAFAASS